MICDFNSVDDFVFGIVGVLVIEVLVGFVVDVGVLVNDVIVMFDG